MSADRTATVADTGRTCPYCRFALKSGVAVTTCGSCDAVHHAECWLDNGGCAIVACEGGPATGVAAPAADATPAPPPAKPRPAAAPAAAGAGAQATVSRRRSRAALLAAAALAIAATAVAITVLLTRGDDATPVAGHVVTTQVLAARPQATVDEPKVAVSTVAAPPPSTSSKESSTSAAAERDVAIAAVVGAYFRAVRAGSFDGAWDLLSPTYRTWKAAEGGGFARWQRQERRNRQRLRGRPAVEVRSYDPSSHVATIYVSGLRFKPEGRAECAYIGVTWARKVGDRWLYDQGYSQNPARRARWRPRKSETLGSTCDTSGY